MLDRVRVLATVASDVFCAVCIELEPHVRRQRARIRAVTAVLAATLAVWWLFRAAPVHVADGPTALAHSLDAAAIERDLDRQCQYADMAYGCAALAVVERTGLRKTPVCVLGALPTSYDGQVHTAHRFVLWLDCSTRFWPQLEGPVVVSAHNGRQLSLRDDVWITGDQLPGGVPVHVQGTAALCLGVTYHRANYTTMC